MANTETEVMRRALLATTALTTLLRNNVGAYRTKDGGWVRYGVGGPGGADTVGWTTKVVTPDMVGMRVAVFTAVEFKAPGGSTTPEQDAFIKAVCDAGGLAGVARCTEDVMDIIA